jgi:ribose 1,5-bisphosphokinase
MSTIEGRGAAEGSRAEPPQGRLVLVVGPSGAGKDTLIDAARDVLTADPRWVFPRRTVTRPPSEAEDNTQVDEAAFLAAKAEGAFALSWVAHGHHYGIPASIETDLAAGRVVIANVSRTVIAMARARWALVEVVEITAPAEVLAARIAARGRASDGAGAERLSRRFEPGEREVADITIDNSADLDSAVAAFLFAVVGN